VPELTWHVQIGSERLSAQMLEPSHAWLARRTVAIYVVWIVLFVLVLALPLGLVASEVIALAALVAAVLTNLAVAAYWVRHRRSLRAPTAR
jgi:hypothetical protein